MEDNRASAEGNKAEHADLRVQMTSKIWGTMPALLALSIPLCAIANNGVFIPIAALLAAGVGTAAIWMRGGAAVLGPALPDAAATKHFRELEERLANLEAITNFEHKLLDKKYPDAAPVPAAPAFSFETPVSSSPIPVDSGAEEVRRGASRPIAS